MARIFRFSGYLVSKQDDISISDLIDVKEVGNLEKWQQVHIEQSEPFTLDGEDNQNCDISLLIRHFKSDNSSTKFDRPVPQKGEKYKYFKIGRIVTILGISRHTETEEVSVVYECDGRIWNRPLEMFMSEVDKKKYPNAKQKYRFELVDLLDDDE